MTSKWEANGKGGTVPQPNDFYFARRRRKARNGLEGGCMQVIGGRENPAPLLSPGVDFITENAPQQQEAGERVIDTGIDFVPGVATRLNGRKYISENTAKDLAKLVGYVDGDEARRIQAEFDAYRANVGAVLDSLKGFGSQLEATLASVPNAPEDRVPDVPADQQAQLEAAAAKQEGEAQSFAASEAALADTAAAEEDTTNG